MPLWRVAWGGACLELASKKPCHDCVLESLGKCIRSSSLCYLNKIEAVSAPRNTRICHARRRYLPELSMAVVVVIPVMTGNALSSHRSLGIA
jgi:hypothetical protein